MNRDNIKFTPELIDLLDSISASPTYHASETYALLKTSLPDIDDYALACFCLEFLSAMANTKLNFLTNDLIRVNHIFRYAHYLRIIEECQESSHPKLPQIMKILNSTSGQG